MNRKQAMALLTLIADLYTVIQAPEPEAAPQTPSNGKGQVDTTQVPTAAATAD